jgi:hypothetical protein
MSTQLHCYQYVNRPFDAVRDALILDAVGLFERGTKSATTRAHSLVSNLKVSVAGIDVGKDIVVKVTSVRPHDEAPGHMAKDAVSFDLEWAAETSASLFPAMKATLVAYALGANETQLDLVGHYEPPGGVLGNAADWLVGHRIAEASVKRFLDDVAGRLSEELG